jgi:hypothetical protein
LTPNKDGLSTNYGSNDAVGDVAPIRTALPNGGAVLFFALALPANQIGSCCLINLTQNNPSDSRKHLASYSGGTAPS